MPSEELSVSSRAAAALSLLKPIAKSVSDAAAALATPVMGVDAELKRMHIAFEAWVTYKTSSYEHLYTNWDIGYSRIGGRWGIALRIVRGDHTDPEDTRVENWHFNESPLYLRHRAVDKLPELLEALAKTGENVAHKLASAATRATEIAETMSTRSKVKK